MAKLKHMTQEERQERYKKLMTQPVGVLIELIVKLEEDNEKTREYRKRLMQIRNLATDKEDRRPIGRPKKEED